MGEYQVCEVCGTPFTDQEINIGKCYHCGEKLLCRKCFDDSKHQLSMKEYYEKM